MKRTMRQMEVLGLTAAAVFAFAVGSAQAATYEWSSTSSNDWTVDTNWTAGNTPRVPPTGGSYAHRVNVTGTATLNYTSAQGNTTYTGGRGLVLYNGSSVAIQGGSFTGLGDIISATQTAGATATMTIAGGTYNSNRLDIGWYNSTGIFTISSGQAAINDLHINTADPDAALGMTGHGTLNLNGGTLSVDNIVTNHGSGSSTVNLNGGTLRAQQNNDTFITSGAYGLRNLLVGEGGAKIDTNTFNVTIAKALTPDGASTGGLTKSGTGTLTLSAANTFTGETRITAATLALSGAGALASETITVDSDATLDVSGTTSSLLTLGSGQTLGGDGTVAGNLAFGSDAKLAFSATLSYTGTSDITFSNFSLSSILGLDETAEVKTYTLIDGLVDFSSGISNVGYDERDSIGGGKEAYFQEGSLQLVVIPEPGTIFLLTLGALAVGAVRRRRLRG